MGVNLTGVGLPTALKGMNFAASGTGEGAGAAVDYKAAISTRINLGEADARQALIADMKPVYTAGVAAFNALPMATQFELADVTHNQSYFYAQVLDQLRADGEYVAPVMPEFNEAGEVVGTTNVIVPGADLAPLMACLTEDGKAMVKQMLSKPDKAFLKPADILDGKEADFYAFFGKTSAKAVAKLVDLKAQGKGTKILNNLYMEAGVLLSWVDVVFTGEANAAMKTLLMDLQKEAVVDSAIIIAAQDLSYIAADQADPAFHQLWMTHNDWGSYGCDPLAAKNWEDLTETEQGKDTVIRTTHTAMRAKLATIIDAVKEEI